jgi:hypothetical protein
VSVNDDVMMSHWHADSMRTIPDCTLDRTRTLLPQWERVELVSLPVIWCPVRSGRVMFGCGRVR